MLDLIPSNWLHITVQGIGFIDEIEQDEAAAIRQEITERASELNISSVTFQNPTVRPEAVYLKAFPAEPIYALREQIHAGASAVLGNRMEPLPEPDEYAPHVSIAYINSESSASPIKESIRSIKAEPVAVKFTKIDFLEFHRDNRMYEWTTATPIPLGALRQAVNALDGD
jgi:2'-5' RNA ligase